MHFPTRFAMTLAVLLAGGCDAATMVAAPDSPVQAVGILAWEAKPAPGTAAPGQANSTPGVPRPGVDAPDTVRAGAAFQVVVTTVGPTVCWRPAGAHVDAQPAAVTVTPYDFTPEDPVTTCGDALVQLSRPVTLVFSRPGDAVLRVQGRRVVGGNLQSEEKIVLEKTIHVR